MKQRLIEVRDRAIQFWRSRSKGQKGLLIFGPLLFIILVTVLAIFLNTPNMVPLYNNLSPAEAGQIKQTLDARGVKSALSDNGTTIDVPQEMADSLKVDLAAQGIPNTGSIDYSYFSKNAGFGMTDQEFNVLKLKATQTELTNLIKGIDGVQDAKVMINIPQDTVFVGEQAEPGSASIVVQMKPGYQLDQNKVNGLYHLVSKSVPNLSTDNIVIMDQNFQYYDYKNGGSSPLVSDFSTQQDVKTKIERDLQMQVQRMLGTMMGQDKVVVSVTADLDFTQEKREENLVEPVDKKNMAGITVSAERINETYTGKGAKAGGVNGSGASDVPGYQSSSASGDGNYDKTEERLNYEVNRIKKQIVESPYKIRDLGIQVMVEPPNANSASSLPQGRVNDIKQILSTIVRTSIDKKEIAQPLTNTDLANKIVVSVQPFSGKTVLNTTQTQGVPLWVYIAGGVLVVIIILLLILLLRRRNKDNSEYYEEEIVQEIPLTVPDLDKDTETEGTLRRKQLEKMAKEKPEDFAKLLRTWLSED
ncbi:flagellar basal-body MS-ring/collar protein FliF [Metabacillus sp. RGM 3146]|uniref:flagellar basal-body MS-ring/collar protein FliF n=1 Tax=Metabacillus sp. RGM 3146 TaxID=3401092 RepID=UPI003B9C5FD6